MTYYSDMPDHSKVWIYQSSRAFRDVEVQGIRHRIKEFISDWKAHGEDLKAFGDVYYNQFIVIIVDEAQAKASGCSIDSSVHFIKEIEATFEVNLFDRLTIAVMLGQDIHLMEKTEFKSRILSGEIDENTIVFNNMVANKEAFETKWKIPVKDSWHKQLVA